MMIKIKNLIVILIGFACVLVLSYCTALVVLSYIVKHFNSFDFNHITLILGLIIGLLYSTIAFLFFRSSYKILNREITNYYTNEVIIYFYQPIVRISIFIEFLVGVFIGGYILPFFFFDVNKIKMVTSETFFLYLILGSFSFIFTFFLGTYSVFLTNKRIIGICCFDMLKKTDLLLSEIKEIKINKKNIILIGNNNLTFPLTSYPNNIECYNKISYLSGGKF